MSEVINIRLKSLHSINIHDETVSEIDISSSENDFGSYLRLIARKVTGINNDSREFIFSSETTEVRSQVNKILEEESNEPLNVVANRLVRIEVDAQEKYRHLTIIQEGSLLQALVEIDDNEYFIITKVDHTDFLDESDLTKKVGLPFEEHVLKACVIDIEDNEIQEIVRVYDTLTRVSEYWWKDFLELTEAKSDEKNTRNAFKALELHLVRKLKRYHTADFNYLLNNLIAYFRTNESYNHQDMIDSVVGNYDPVDLGFNVEDLRESLEDVGKRKTFDRNFNIVQSIVKKKYSRTIPLDNKIDLKLKEDIDDLKGGKITARKAKDGRKYVVIESEQGYEYFRVKEDYETDNS